MTVPLATADDALYTALSTLLTNDPNGPTEAHPFACVGRFAGALGENEIREVCSAYPAALLAFGGETTTRTVNTLAGDAEDRGVLGWTVYVAVEDPAAIDDGTIGTAARPGGLRLVDAVIGVLSGLLIDGAWMNRRLRCTGTREALIRRGVVYVYAIGFELLRALPEVTPADTSVDMTEIRGDVNRADTLYDDNPDNPRVQFVAATED